MAAGGVPHDITRDPPIRAAMDVLAVCLLGLMAHLLIDRASLGEISSSPDVFFHLFWRFERPFLLLTGASAALFGILARFRGRALPPMPAGEQGQLSHRRLVLVLAALVLLGTYAGRSLVMHDVALSMDEFNAVFQSKIFAAGETTARVAEEWRPFVDAMRPIFIQYDGDAHSWTSKYWPVYAAIRAAFLRVGAAGLVNPVFAALSLVVLWALARRLWPGDRRAWFAVLAFVTSSQFVLTSMTESPMPAHLLLNTVWLWLFVRGGRVALAVAPVVGGFALGVHNPFPHALFVWPFLLRLLRTRRWGVLAYFGAVYLVASGGWIWWMKAHASYGGDAGLMRAPDLHMLIVQVMSLAESIAWMSPFFAITLLLALRSWRTLSATEVDLAAGIAATFLFYTLVSFSQGHGWGYRYLHPVLGNLALLAASGVGIACRALGISAVRRVVLASVLLSALVQLPLRVREAKTFVAQFAPGLRLVRMAQAPVVVVESRGLWYGVDLLRNDPYLGPPIVLLAERLTPELRAQLDAMVAGEIRNIDRAELARRGWPVVGSSGASPARERPP
jgi:hypothetical protein